MKKLVLVCLLVLGLIMPYMADAAEKATPEEIHEMVLNGVQVLENLGEEGLAAFNDPEGEFVWKDTYVFVLSCKLGKVAAHPMAKIVGLTTDKIKCFKTGRPIMKDACGQVDPNGFWTEYWWPKVGSKKPERKLVFLIPVPGTDYQVGAGIYDDQLSLAKLNKMR